MKTLLALSLLVLAASARHHHRQEDYDNGFWPTGPNWPGFPLYVPGGPWPGWPMGGRWGSPGTNGRWPSSRLSGDGQTGFGRHGRPDNFPQGGRSSFGGGETSDAGLGAPEGRGRSQGDEFEAPSGRSKFSGANNGRFGSDGATQPDIGSDRTNSRRGWNRAGGDRDSDTQASGTSEGFDKAGAQPREEPTATDATTDLTD